MLLKVKNFIEQNKMIEKGDRIVLGVSGGADSVCLLYMLSEICRDQKIPVLVVHINHGIRGKDAEGDEQYVKVLCKKLNLEFLKFRVNVPQIAMQEGLSEEEAGRKIRYRTFFQVCKDKQCNKIAIAHNKNDIAETVLFHLFRGTGIRGLSGIQPVIRHKPAPGEITVIRPLLCLEREEIEDYLRERSISYQTDATNLTDAYSRNKIRNHILSYAVKEINSNAVPHIAQTALQLREIESYINDQIKRRYEALTEISEERIIGITVNQLQKEDIVIQKGIVRKILEELTGNLKNLEAKHVEQVLSLLPKQVGKQIDLPYGVLAVREYDKVIFYPDRSCGLPVEAKERQREPVAVRVPGKYYLPELRKFLVVNIINYEKNQPIPKSSCMKWFDYDKIENAVVVRYRKEGDYIQINPSGGRKKLKDYFIDQKIPRRERDHKPLVADGSHIMWIPGDGDRISEKYKVDESTKTILLMKLIDTEDF
jgi:tRNA(Ile)-lysidine synthase